MSVALSVFVYNIIMYYTLSATYVSYTYFIVEELIWHSYYNNLQTIASQWHINIQDLIDGVPVPKPNLADKLDGLCLY